MEQIILECKKYNRFAQKLLYEKYAPEMKGLCMRYVNDKEIVNDLVQEGFIKVFSKISDFNGRGSFEGWIKRIFINTTISHLRSRQKTHRYLKIDEIDDDLVGHSPLMDFEEHVDLDLSKLQPGQNDFQMVLMADFSEMELLDVLQKVPEKYRMVFNLFFIEEFKHEEIAEMLELDVTTSRTRLLRARNIIRKKLYEMSIDKLSKKTSDAQQ